MSEHKKMTCILCPVGCEINVQTQDGKIENISGNACKRGEKYATTEVIDPRRTLTTTVRVSGGAAASGFCEIGKPSAKGQAD